MVGFIGQNSTLNIILPGATAMKPLIYKKKTKNKGLSVNWAVFSRPFLEVLGLHNLMMPQEALSQLKQIPTAQAYQEKFELSQLKQISTAQAYQKLPEHFGWLLCWWISG